MSLVFTSNAKPEVFKRVYEPTFANFKPVPPHKCVTFNGTLPIPEKDDIVLLCGPGPFEALKASGLIAKNKGLDKWRETPIPYGDGHYMVTYCPSIVDSDPNKRDALDWDVRLAHRFMTTGTLKPIVGNYRWVSSYAPMIAEIEAEFAKTGKPVKVAFDTETMGLYPWYPDKDIVCTQFTHKRGHSQLMYFGPRPAPIRLDHSTPLYDQMKWLLTSPKVRIRGANLKFDLNWVFAKWGIDCTNFTFDTLLVGALLNENRSNSLNLQAKMMTTFGGYDDSFNKTVDKGHMEKVDPKDLLVYAGGDTDACYQVAEVLQNQLDQDPELRRFYVTILHPAARAFEKIERRGILVDQAKYDQLRKDLEKTIAESTERQLDLLPWQLKIKHRDAIFKQIAKGANPFLPSIKMDYFFTPQGLDLQPLEWTETGKPNLSKSHLLRVLEGVQNGMGMLKEMTEGDRAEKTLSTFVEGFLKHLRPDGRFHPSYHLFHGFGMREHADDSGTVTGRLSATEPAFQTIPKKGLKGYTNWAKRLRECFIAPKGKVVVSIDYNQGELRVVACIAHEKKMIRSYLDGLDLHAVTGARLAQVDFKEFMSWKDNADKTLAGLFEHHRGNAKPANFGLLYGQQAEGFQAYAWKNYGIKLTLQEAEQMRDAFFELYPGLVDYHKVQRMFVRNKGYVRSPLGRIRHLPDIYSTDRMIASKAGRRAINSPTQATLADLMEWTIAIVDQEFDPEDVAVVGNVHDALIAYMDEAKVDTLIPQVLDIMSNLPLHKLDWKPELKFIADAEYGPNLAEMVKWKAAA